MSELEEYESLLKDYADFTASDEEGEEAGGLVTREHIQIMVLIKGVLANKTWTRIAEDLNITRRRLYDLRHSIEVHEFVDALWEEQLKDISALKGRGDLVDAMKFRNQLIQAITPRILRQKVKADVTTEFVFRIEAPSVAKDSDNVEATPETA